MDVLKKSWDSGVSGFKAMTIGVFTLMWLGTISNYQYRNGTTVRETARILWSQGGIPRFYNGISFALVIGPLSRFGDAFTNTLALESLRNYSVPIFVKTFLGSVCSGFVRIFLNPIDAMKNIHQVHGKEAHRIITNKIKTSGVLALYRGALANGLGTVIGHYPWFVTHNYLEKYWKKYQSSKKQVARNAVIGFISSVVSETTANSMKVIKTYRQTSEGDSSYYQVVKKITKKDGLKGLFFRGLKVRLFSNAINGLLFNVLWKVFEAKN